MKVLITGGAGFIGSSLANFLFRKGYEVHVLDNLSTGSVKNLDSRSHFYDMDVNDDYFLRELFFENNFDYVFHYAAVVGVQRTLKNPTLVLNDIKGIENIVDLSILTNVKRVFFSSSSEVYGESIYYPQDEISTPLNSRLPYAIVKNYGEAFIKYNCVESNTDFTVLRFFNTYGANQSDDFVIGTFITKALKNEDICIYGDGNQSRTFLYIDDNIKFTYVILEQDSCKNMTVNVGSDVETSINKLAYLIVSLSNSRSNIDHIDELEEGDMARRLPDTTLMKKYYGQNFTTLEEGISKIIEQKTKNTNH